MERLVSVPQNVLYSGLRDGLASGRVRSIKEVEGSSEPEFIRSKVLEMILFGHLDIHISPRDGWSQLRYNFDFKKFTYIQISALVLAAIVLVLFTPQVIPYHIGILGAALIGLFGSLSVVPQIVFYNRFPGQFEQLIQNIELNHKHETETK